jgi:subtilisin family serine protease
MSKKIFLLLVLLCTGCTQTLYFTVGKSTYNMSYYSNIGLYKIEHHMMKKQDIEKIKVGVIDTGFSPKNSFVDIIPINEVAPTQNQNHGDIVSSIIASRFNSGYEGLLPGHKLYVYHIPSQNMNVSSLTKAIEKFILYKVDVINICLSTEKYDQKFFDAVKEAIDSGITVVASSGNSGDETIQYPAAFQIKGLISVSATDSSFNVLKSSTINKQVDIWAPGEKIYSSDGNNSFIIKEYTGTSVATPIVTSLIVLMKTMYPELKPEEIDSLINKGADHYHASWGVRSVNVALVDFQNTLIICKKYMKGRKL